MATTNENVKINFLTTFNGKGASQAAAQMGSLEKQATRLGKTLLATFGAQKILGFAKDSLKAFAADQKAAAVLAQTMNNLFLGADTKKVEDYIHALEAASGVTDEKLRPAFANLVRVTHDTAKAQDLMNLAMDVSAGTGKDLETVSSALAKGYLGNTTALGKLGAGLSAADLKSKNFAIIQQKLADLFMGDSKAAANSFQGSMDRLSVSVDNAKETIGKGLVDAFTILAGPDGGVAKAQTAIDDFATNTADALVGLADVAKSTFDFIGKYGSGVLGGTGSDSVFSQVTKRGKWGVLANWGKKVKADKAAVEMSNQAGINVEQTRQNILAKQAEKAAKISSDQAKQQAALLAKQTADKKKQLDLDKAAFVLKQAGRFFDNTAIQLAAAAANMSLNESDRKRVELKQTLFDLQVAIDNKDSVLATALAARVKEEQAGIQGLSTAISSIPQAPDALATLKKSALDLQEQYKTLIELQKQLNPTPAPNIAGSVLNPELAQGIAGVPLMPQGSLNQYILSPELFSQVAQKDVMIHLTLDDNLNIGAKASDYLANTSANGTPSTLRRLNPINVGLS